jgi:hypothetical protein
MIINLEEAFDNFWNMRRFKFKEITDTQKMEWIKAVEKQIKNEVEGNDIWWDNDDVVDLEEIE